MDRPTCKTCPYWDAHSDSKVGGDCLRFPPTFPPNKILAKQAYVISDNAWYGIWPETSHFNWCGEHPDTAAWIASLERDSQSQPDPPTPTPPDSNELDDHLARALEGAWQRGELTPEAIERSIKEFRARHPYRPPDGAR